MADLEDAEALDRRQPGAGQPELGHDPALQAVRAEVLLDDEVGDPCGRQPRQPGAQEVVEGGLADADGWVGPDDVEGHVRRDPVRGGGVHVVQPEGGRVAAAQVERALVDVQRVHRGGGGAQSQGEGHRAPARPEVEEGALVGRGRRVVRRTAVPLSRPPGEKTPRATSTSSWRPARRTRSGRRSPALAGSAVK